MIDSNCIIELQNTLQSLCGTKIVLTVHSIKWHATPINKLYNKKDTFLIWKGCSQEAPCWWHNLEFLHLQGCCVGHSIIDTWIQVQNGGLTFQSWWQFVTALTCTVLILMISDDCFPYVSVCISQHCGSPPHRSWHRKAQTTFAITLHLLINMLEHNLSVMWQSLHTN